jgi:N-acetylmuramoyl-L-alanine amidase
MPRHPSAIQRLLAAFLLCGSSFLWAAEIDAVRVWAGPEYTRVVFDVSGPLDYKMFGLAGPDRVVLDVKATALGKRFGAAEGAGLLRGVRTGPLGDSDLRVVFDLTESVKPRSFLLTPAEKLGYRLVVDLYPESATPTPARTVAQALPSSDRDVVIAIDAGHGGEDPGARGPTGVWEKNITLAVARELAKKIDAEPGMTAYLVRNGDYFIPLQKRYRKAREAKADLFVSIHADAFHRQAAAGASVYVLSTRGASGEAARWLADRENASDLVGGVSFEGKDNTLAAVLLDLSQSATMKGSKDAAGNVLAALKRVGNAHKPNVEHANFVVLRSPDVPSMLVETAFISNPDEERKLNDPVYRRRLAAAIRDGVRDYFHVQPPPGTWLANNVQAPRGREHVVSRGETLSLIASRHNVPLALLRAANSASLRGDVVRVGERLRIPGGPG